jgi:heat shock protein HslJ
MSGCNRLTGSYKLDGDQLRFGEIAGTMMACLQGMDTEKQFLQALGRVARWKIAGGTLSMFDNAGAAIATFEARRTK